jgi:integrase
MQRIRKRGARFSYEVRVREADGWRWISTGTHDKIAATAHLKDLERRAADPAYAAAAEATTEEVLREFLASRRARGRSEGTLHHYRIKSGALVRLLPKLAKSLTHRVLEKYISDRIAEGVQQTTVKKELGTLRSALSLARKNERFDRDPRAIIPELAETYRPRTRVLTREELQALLAALQPTRAAHVAWIVGTGARWGESLRVRREDHGPDAVRIRGTKTALSDRVVPYLSTTRRLIEAALAGVRAPAGVPLFRAWGSVRRDLEVACKLAQIDKVSPNDLRRTFATWLRQGGAEPSLIGQALGHADARMVERVYGRLSHAELALVLESRLRPKE